MDDSFHSQREEQVAASLPTLCSYVLAVTVVYTLSLYFLRPAQFWSALPLSTIQILVPLAIWSATRTSWRRHAQAMALAGDLTYTACLSLQFFVPESNTSGTALFIAVKLLATALFFPWSARVQYLSSTATVLVYWASLYFAGRVGDSSAFLHQVLGVPIAALLAAAGTGRADRVRRELFRQNAVREELVERLQMILDRMPVGCIIHDAEFRFTYLNPAAERIFGYSFEELRGRRALDVINLPKLREISAEGFRRLGKGDSLGPGRVETGTKDGRIIVCEWMSAPLRGHDGTFAGVLSMCQDVTARQRDEEEKGILLEELKSANRLKSDFVATMSHELRTPLNVVLGYNDLLLEDAFGGLTGDQRDVLGRVGQSARELLELIDATLDVSRLEAGRMAVKKQPVNLQQLVAQVDAETREAQQRSRARVEWRIPDGLPVVETDPVKLKVVLKNLFTNALKFTDDGAVVVSAGAVNGGVELRVADTGIGIPPEALPIIFEPFRQVDGSATRRHGGVGLGLYIVRRLVDMLGSTITVESEVGRGTTFRVTLR